MSKKQPQLDEQKFDAFLEKHFAELRRELDAHILKTTQSKDGKILSANPRTRGERGRTVNSWASRKSSWVYSVAALALVAIATPMVMQLNQEKAEARSDLSVSPSASAAPQLGGQLEQDESPSEQKQIVTGKRIARKKSAVSSQDSEQEYFRPSEKDADNLALAQRAEPAKKEELSKMRAAPMPTLRSVEEASPAATGGEKFDDAKVSDRVAAQEKPTAPAPAAPRMSAGAPANSPEFTTASREAKGRNVGESSKSRAPVVRDEIKLDSVESEKAEMERLWKEFDRDPKSFSKDSKRSSRLKMLLARHDTKSKARAKRVAAESQLTQ